ncbi:MAG: DUF819 family protein [Bacteroidia bacterium]
MLLTGCLITIITFALVKWLDRQTSPIIKKVLEWFPAILFAYVVPAIASHSLGVNLSGIELHQWSKDLIMPLAILTVMSALSFKQLKMIGLRPIILFALGSLVIATAPIIMVLLARYLNLEVSEIILEDGYWKGLVPVVGGWIGGSTSQLVLKEVVECPESIFIAILVMDNVLVNIWTILMFQFIKRSDQWNQLFKIEDQVKDFVPDEVKVGKEQLQSIIWTSVICVMVIGLSYFLIENFLAKIILLSLVGLALGNFIPIWNHGLVLKIGGYLIILIMAILGLKLNFDSFALPWQLIVFCIIWLISHFVVMIAGARIMKLHFAWIPIASMANVGGISTAPAVTAAYNEEWMPHAVILAVLSMVSGTTWGLLTIYLFSLL